MRKDSGSSGSRLVYWRDPGWSPWKAATWAPVHSRTGASRVLPWASPVARPRSTVRRGGLEVAEHVVGPGEPGVAPDPQGRGDGVVGVVGGQRGGEQSACGEGVVVDQGEPSVHQTVGEVRPAGRGVGGVDDAGGDGGEQVVAGGGGVPEHGVGFPVGEGEDGALTCGVGPAAGERGAVEFGVGAASVSGVHRQGGRHRCGCWAAVPPEPGCGHVAGLRQGLHGGACVRRGCAVGECGQHIGRRPPPSLVAVLVGEVAHPCGHLVDLSRAAGQGGLEPVVQRAGGVRVHPGRAVVECGGHRGRGLLQDDGAVTGVAEDHGRPRDGAQQPGEDLVATLAAVAELAGEVAQQGQRDGPGVRATGHRHRPQQRGEPGPRHGPTRRTCRAGRTDDAVHRLGEGGRPPVRGRGVASGPDPGRVAVHQGGQQVDPPTGGGVQVHRQTRTRGGAGGGLHHRPDVVDGQRRDHDLDVPAQQARRDGPGRSIRIRHGAHHHEPRGTVAPGGLGVQPGKGVRGGEVEVLDQQQRVAGFPARRQVRQRACPGDQAAVHDRPRRRTGGDVVQDPGRAPTRTVAQHDDETAAGGDGLTVGEDLPDLRVVEAG
jgi:hypothetical protein